MIFFKKVNTEKVHEEITVTNFWPMVNPLEELWFIHFIRARKIAINRHLHLISVFGGRPRLNTAMANVFYTGENTDERFWRFRNLMLNRADLSLGFKELTKENYIRLPHWFLLFIPPQATFLDVHKIIDEANYTPNFYTRPYKYALIASHDRFAKKRRKIVEEIEDKDKILFAGKFRNNTNLLLKDFEDNKVAFLQNVQFNICPENSNANGYVTEKIFEAIKAGCIPIYWGSDNNPEPNILNKEAIIFFDEKINLNAAINSYLSKQKNIEEIPRFLPNAADCINETLFKLETAFKKILA